MRTLGLDIGSKRIGVAVSDPGGRVATPVKVLEAGSVQALRRMAEDYEAEKVVVGLPKTLSGEEGPQAASVREAAERIGSELGVPVVYFDERLSSAEAKRSMAQAGLSERRMRGKLDAAAACLVLQAYLDSTRGDHR